MDNAFHPVIQPAYRPVASYHPRMTAWSEALDCAVAFVRTVARPDHQPHTIGRL